MSPAPANPLKWIAAITGVITLVLGLNQVVRVFAEVGERQRQLAELQTVAERQREVGDYAAAWTSLERALAAADRHCAAALASGRQHDFVRRLQLAALRNYSSLEVEDALLRAVDEMRRNGEVIDDGTRDYLFRIYRAAFNSDLHLRRVLGALLQEEAGDREGALATWRAVQKALGPDDEGRVDSQADAALARLTPGGQGSRSPSSAARRNSGHDVDALEAVLNVRAESRARRHARGLRFRIANRITSRVPHTPRLP